MNSNANRSTEHTSPDAIPHEPTAGTDSNPTPRAVNTPLGDSLAKTQRVVMDTVMGMKAKQIEMLIGLYRKPEALPGTADLGEMHRRMERLAVELDISFQLVQTIAEFGFNCGISRASSIASSAGAMEKAIG
tara:strand:- start:5982 stop:6377 length:396 start_codon:yes stop_codon:yes gene_type:complete